MSSEQIWSTNAVKKRQDDECGAHRKSIRWSDHEHALHRWEHSRCCVWRVFVREVSREGLKVCKVNCWEKVLGWDRGHIYIAWLLVVVGSFWKMGCYLDSWIKLNIFLVSFPLNQDPGVFSHLALWLAVENGLQGKFQLEELKFSGDTHQQFGRKNRPFVPNGKDRLPTIHSQVPD